MSVLVIAFLSFLTCEIWAAPALSSVQGQVSEGTTITLSGSGFGAGPTVVLFDSFEKGALGSKISTAANSADIGNWNTTGSPSQTYSNEQALSGTKAMKLFFNTWGAGPHLRYPNVQNSDIFISWWQLMPVGANVPGTYGPEAGLPNWKWFWIGDQGDDWPWGSDFISVCLDNNNCGAIMGVIPADDTGAPARGGGGWYETSFRKGTWQRVSVALRNATSGGYVWKQEISSNGHFVKFNKTNLSTAHADDPWNVLSLPGFGRQDNTATIYYDDVYVATGNSARARVEIGNAPTYAASTNLALITPTSWSDTQISAVVRQGSFKGGDSAYLFVIDANGSASPGRQITIGGTPKPAPSAPTDLHVVE